jgi:hypothetical protein
MAVDCQEPKARIHAFDSTLFSVLTINHTLHAYDAMTEECKKVFSPWDLEIAGLRSQYGSCSWSLRSMFRLELLDSRSCQETVKRLIIPKSLDLTASKHPHL